MNTAEAYIAIIGGALVIGAALWRVGTAMFNLVRKFDRLFNEHDVMLKTLATQATAIEQLQRRAERRARTNG